MKTHLSCCAAILMGFLGTSVFAQTDSNQMLQKGIDAQKMGKDGEAFEWFLEAAQAGNVQGQYHAGYCYLTGQGTALDDDQARQWFLKAAGQGDGKSERNLGNIYENGWGGVAPDMDAAKNWYQRAVQHGCTSAQADLDRLEKNSAKASSRVPTPSNP